MTLKEYFSAANNGTEYFHSFDHTDHIDYNEGKGKRKSSIPSLERRKTDVYRGIEPSAL